MLTAVFALALGAATSGALERIEYPPTKALDLVETLHGVPVADPYRWLEDLNAPETAAWVEAQNAVTSRYLSSIPERERIARRLTRLFDYERFRVPFQRKGRLFYFRNEGLQNQPVLWVQDDAKSQPRVLIDPNTLSKDGTVALGATSPSTSGKLLAYSVSAAGSDWMEWRVRNVETGKDLPDRIRWAKFTGASWTADDTGFYYGGFDPPGEGEEIAGVNRGHKVYFHRIGSTEETGTLFYERRDQPDWFFGPTVSEDGRYMVIGAWHGTDRNNRVFYKDLRDRSLRVRELLGEADASYDFIGNDGQVLYFMTDRDAPMSKVVAIDLAKRDPEQWRTVVPERPFKLTSASMVADRLIVQYVRDARNEVEVYCFDGRREGAVRLPGIGSAGGFAGRREDKDTYYAFTSFTTPATIYRVDVASRRTTLFKRPKLDFDPKPYVVEQVFYESKDGTRVPMFLVHRKDMAKTGDVPTLMYGYGGFAASQTPWFGTSNAVWLEMGGMLCIMNLRGGSEYGNAWHDGGRLANKQNVFDDCIAAAEYLQKNGYTNPSRTAVQGGSNGGLLVGAVINQRPDLFGVALPAVGVMDMLRFHLFTIGWAWKAEYGDPDVEEDFKVLLAYSPYHNLKPGTRYPATLVTTGDHDDRVVPSHSFKYGARLQACQAGDAPTLLRIETRAGHGAGKPLDKVVEELADVLAFSCKNMKMTLPESFGK